MRISYLFIVTAILGMASGCASKPEKASCDQRDWFQMGRNDGARGSTTDQLQKRNSDCSQIRSDWESMYLNGRNAGLVEYCSAENAYELGRMGNPYLYVCPSTMEAQFLAGYRKGQRARELEMESRRSESPDETTAGHLESQGDTAARPSEQNDASKTE